jgi:IclR family KDG regulon transcriptional repressor
MAQQGTSTEPPPVRDRGLVHRVLLVLAAFRDPREELGVTDIATALHMDKSVVQRIVAAMREHRFLDQDPHTRKYRVGLRTWEIGRRFTAGWWVDQAIPMIAELARRTGGTGYVASLDGTEIVYLATVDGSGPFRVHVDVGSRAAAVDTALGKAILALLSASELQPLLDRICNEGDLGRDMPLRRERQDIERELSLIREQGYGVNRGESRRGVGAVGVAVANDKGTPIGAISVGFPMMTEYEELWDILPAEVMRIAAEVSSRLA